MYLEEINIENYGSIEKLKYKMPFNENGNPKPLVIKWYRFAKQKN